MANSSGLKGNMEREMYYFNADAAQLNDNNQIVCIVYI